MTKILIFGASGRMGQEIAEIIGEQKSLKLAYQVDKKKSGDIVTLDSVSAKNVDVVIDFSHADAVENIIKFCVSEKRPLVSGTTGLSKETKSKLQKASSTIPIMWSPNMSLGIAVLNKAIQSLAALDEFDFQIEEIHHSKKKDAPSGTAILLQETLEKTVQRKPQGPLSIRGGGVFGIHRIFAMGEEETLMFEHVALNRRVFARGAVKAAEKLAVKKPGFYQLADLFT